MAAIAHVDCEIAGEPSSAEHFPTAGRNLGVAFANGVGHVGGAIGPLLATAVYAEFGFGAVFLTFAVSFALCAFLLLFTKQTSQRNLEAIVVGGA